MSKRVAELSTLGVKARNRLTGLFERFFGKTSERKRFWICFALLSLITSVILTNPFGSSETSGYKIGDIVRERIVSPADIKIEDPDQTRQLREIATESVQPIFELEPNQSELTLRNFTSLWERIQSNGSSRIEVDNDSNLNESQIRILKSRTFSRTETDSIRIGLKESSEGYIYRDDEATQFGELGVAIIDRTKPRQTAVEASPGTNWIRLSDARGRFKDRLEQIRTLSDNERDAVYAAFVNLIRPSIEYDKTSTENAKAASASAVEPVTIELQRSQTIAREGDTITPEIFAQIGAIQNYTKVSRQLNRFLGLLAIVTGLLWAAWKFIENNQFGTRLILSPQRTFALFGFIILMQSVLMAVLFKLADFTAAQNLRAPFNDSGLWGFAIPFAFGSLLMTLLADRRTALLTGLFTALFAGVLAPKPLEFVLYASISSAVAVYGIGRYRSRQSVTTAGLLVGAVGAITTLALIGFEQQPLILNTILLAMGAGLIAGIITAAVTAMFLPICESLFGILTDVKLLELSNADLPVLGQLALRAPGTNQHSHAVGLLAEEASRAIGANGLLARIGSLYHDIGKIAAPEHFVENQMGRNPHDKLKPLQSAKIIISHVTYGMKMARELGLPQRIIDFIPQHHGTRTLHYFLRRAQGELQEGVELDENDFRYPGPKPRFKEAAIMMIADSCEAAARSLSEPNPANIRFIVTKIIDAILSDDQLDECDLTLRELTLIRESIIKSLVAIYHSRIDYPGYSPSEKDGDSRTDSEERGLRYANPADIPISKGGEIEDEAIDRSRPPNS
jgi:putative nucleotidyltransferase with HDIG domain